MGLTSWVGWDGLNKLSSVCFDRGKDVQGGSDGMGIEVGERLRWPAVGVGGGRDRGMGIPACVSLSGSNLSLWDSFSTSLPVIFSNSALLGSYPGCLNPSSSYLLYSSHIPHILVPLVHFYSGPTVLEFWVLLVVVEVREK